MNTNIHRHTDTHKGTETDREKGRGRERHYRNDGMVEGIYVYDVMWGIVSRARNMKCIGPKTIKPLT